METTPLTTLTTLLDALGQHRENFESLTPSAEGTWTLELYDHPSFEVRGVSVPPAPPPCFEGGYDEYDFHLLWEGLLALEAQHHPQRRADRFHAVFMLLVAELQESKKMRTGQHRVALGKRNFKFFNAAGKKVRGVPLFQYPEPTLRPFWQRLFGQGEPLSLDALSRRYKLSLLLPDSPVH